MSNNCSRSRLHTLVVDSVYGGNILDRGVQEYEGSYMKCVDGGSYPFNGKLGCIA